MACRFDAIFMDVQMPDIDGFEAARRIRAAEQSGGRRTPVIALTAHALPGDRERCLAQGMDGYVSNPVDARQLAETLSCIVPRKNDVATAA
jgi:two-component system, sensor histidine kinase and response regulator